jgi:hypothetical protein
MENKSIQEASDAELRAELIRRNSGVSPRMAECLERMEREHQEYIKERDAKQERDPFYRLGRRICYFMGW